jgi:Nuclease-related domain
VYLPSAIWLVAGATVSGVGPVFEAHINYGNYNKVRYIVRMATLIPEKIKDSATSGEEKLARLLRRLPEDWTVYYEPRVAQYQPDFVILAPHLGLLVIELKGWRMSSILSVNQESVELLPSGAGASSFVKNPRRQADDYWQTLKDECKRSKYGRALLQEDGPWRGELCFPVGVVVLFTGIERSQVVKSPHAGVWDAFLLHRILCWLMNVASGRTWRKLRWWLL